MKFPKIINLLGAVALLLSFTACDKDDDKNKPQPSQKNEHTGKVEVHFENVFEDAPFELNKAYQIASGDSIKLSKLRYIVSGITLMNGDSIKYVEPNSYHFIDATSAGIKDKFTLSDVPAGSYNKIMFTVGVDSVTNSSLDLAKGDLVNIHEDMTWMWNTGYTFMFIDGQYYNRDSSNYQNMRYMLGTNANRRTITLTSPETLKVTAGHGASKMHLKNNVKAIFGGPHVITADQIKSSQGHGHHKFYQNMVDNYAAAMFRVDHVHNH